MFHILINFISINSISDMYEINFLKNSCIAYVTSCIAYVTTYCFKLND